MRQYLAEIRRPYEKKELSLTFVLILEIFRISELCKWNKVRKQTVQKPTYLIWNITLLQIYTLDNILWSHCWNTMDIITGYIRISSSQKYQIQFSSCVLKCWVNSLGANNRNSNNIHTKQWQQDNSTNSNNTHTKQWQQDNSTNTYIKRQQRKQWHKTKVSYLTQDKTYKTTTK